MKRTILPNNNGQPPPPPPPQQRYIQTQPQQQQRGIGNGAGRPQIGAPTSMLNVGGVPRQQIPVPVQGMPLSRQQQQQQTGPPQHAQPRFQSMDPMQQRQLVADKLMKDCHSKTHLDQRNNRTVIETSYQTHLMVKEFSSYPDKAPPPNVPLGSIKTRVLVLCMKYSGRVLLQKGKLNEERNLYQIGRTWDLDELKSVTKLANNGFILSLNKVYFWEASENPDLVFKFLRSLVESFGQFTGKYPQLVGLTPESLQLPPLRNGRNGSTSSPLQQPQAPLQSTPVQAPQQPAQQARAGSKVEDPYKDYDFTSNGKLPMKPMKVLSVDRTNASPSTSSYDLSKTTPRTSTGSSHPYRNNSLYEQSNTSQTSSDAHSFVFGEAPSQSQSSIPNSIREESPERKIHEYAKQASNSPLRKYKSLIDPQPSRTSSQSHENENLESAAALGLKLQQHLESGEDLPIIKKTTSQQKQLQENQFVKDFAHTIPETQPLNKSARSSLIGKSPDFGIEEITDESDTEETKLAKSASTSSKIKPLSRSNSQKLLNSRIVPPKIRQQSIDKGLGINASNSNNSVIPDDPLNASMQELQNMLDNQLNFNKVKDIPVVDDDDDDDDLNKVPSQFPPVHKRDFSYDEAYPDSHEQEPSLNVAKKDGSVIPLTNESLIKIDKDNDAEDFFDDANWSITDNSDSIIKKLTKELNKVKMQNVDVLMDINFGNSTIAKDANTAMSEVQNLSHIFKKLEIDFSKITPEINAIETDSQGLQVKSINKKILYNDLKSILQKVKIDPQDLKFIASFEEFDRLPKVEVLESKLLELYNASSTIKDDEENESLSSIKALKQYQSNYEVVGKKFIKHALGYLSIQFKNIVDKFSANLDRFTAHLLLRELSGLTVYSGITYFIKEIGSVEFLEFNQLVNSLFSRFFDQFINNKLRNHGSLTYSSTSTTASLNLSQSLDETVPLKQSRTLRLSKKMSKFSGIGHDQVEEKNEQKLESLRRSASMKLGHGIEDPKFVIQVIEESKDLIALVQYFIMVFFHIDKDSVDFTDYLHVHSYDERMRLADELPSKSIESLEDGKIHSSIELIQNLTSLFGSYINIHIKKLNPVDLNVPVILLYLENVGNGLQNSNQVYLKNNFIDKFKTKILDDWNKFIQTQIDSLNNSIIVAKSGILQPVKNINQLLLITEASLESHQYELRGSKVRELVDTSYKQITDALVHLFMRDDPLLKKNELDDKEREHRNVTILQNLYYILEELTSISRSNSTKTMKSRLDTIFNNVEESYFQRLLHKNIGKLIEFVTNYESLEKMSSGSSNKKYNKKYVKSLLTNYTSKELQVKAGEIYHKLEKHFITGGDMFEKDLLEKLWQDMEQEFIDYITRLNKIIRNDFDRDIDYGIGRQEIHVIFKSIH